VARGTLALWTLRAALAAALGLCAAASYRYWSGRPSIVECLRGTRDCTGLRIDATRFLEARPAGAGSWELHFPGAPPLRTATPLPGVRPGDLLELSLSFTAPRRVQVQSFTLLRPWRLRLRVAVSALASLVVVALVLRRLLRRRRAREANGA
jgi:hypothetical protein